MGNSKFQSDFLSSLFSGLNNKGVPYCILRNYEGLPESNSSKDVDILIESNMLEVSRDILSQTAKETNAKYYSEQHFQAIECFDFYTEKMDSVKVDFFFNFETRGAKFLDGEEILGKKRAFKSFFVADEVHDAVISWLKPLITGGVIKEKYREKIISVASKKTKEFKECTTHVVGNSLSNKLMPLILDHRLDETLEYTYRIKIVAWLRSLIREPYRVIKNFLIHYAVEVKRQILFPKKKMVVIIGPDGTGKTTVIEKLSDHISELCKYDKKKVKIFHFRPSMLPNLKRLLTPNKSRATDEEFTRPHRAQPSGFIMSLFRQLYYFTDYTVGYFIKVRPLFAKGNLVFFDRYFYDFIVDPARSRVKLPQFIPLFLMKLVPKPKVAIYLDNDTETILKRKQELSKNELSRQLTEYRNLTEKFPWFYRVDGRKPVEDIVREISAIYVKEVTKPV